MSSPTAKDWEQIHYKAWTDKAFRETLETDPTKAIQDFGKEVHGKPYTKIVSTHGWVEPSAGYKSPPAGSVGVLDSSTSSGPTIYGCCSSGSAHMPNGPSAGPRFLDSLHPVPDPGGGVFLLSETKSIRLSHPVYAVLAPLLDGRHGVAEIFSAALPGFPGRLVFEALDALRSGGLITEEAGDGPRPLRAFWEYAGASPAEAAARLRDAAVATAALGSVEMGPLDDLLRLHGISVSASGAAAVVVTDDYLNPDLATWNARALRSGRPWLLTKPIGLTRWLGPLFVPGQTGCWACLAQRLVGHRKLEAYLARQQGCAALPSAPAAWLPAMPQAALAEAATEITRFLGTGGSSALLGSPGIDRCTDP